MKKVPADKAKRSKSQANFEQAIQLDEQLTLMAADPEIQNELRNIEQEFAFAESDGLENS